MDSGAEYFTHKTGLTAAERYDETRLSALLQKSQHDPGALTDAELQEYAAYNVHGAVAAYEVRQQARESKTHKAALEAFLGQHGRKPVTFNFLFKQVLPTETATHRELIRRMAAIEKSAAPPLAGPRTPGSESTEMAELRRQVKDLAEQLQEVKEFKWCGVWAPEVTYRKHNCTTWSGSMWTCVATISRGEKPGTPAAPSRSWKLVVQRGKEGKGGRNDD